MPTTSVLERRSANLAEELAATVEEIERYVSDAGESFDAQADDYTALREKRDKVEDGLSDLIATINARKLSSRLPTPTDDSGEQISHMRQVLREYDRGNSERFSFEYEIRRAYEVLTTDPASGTAMFKPTPSRIQVPEVPIITPTLDSVRTVQTGNAYDFTVPPPPVAAQTVPEGGTKPAVEFDSALLQGTLETDAHGLDVSRQTLEDDATAERALRNWLSEGVRLRQDAKTAAAIAGATGTLTASGDSLLKSIRYGKAQLSKMGIRATSVYVNPDDAAEADIEAMAVGHTGPEGLATYWRMTAIENPGITAGTAIVGAMPQAVYLLYRNSIASYLTDSGETFETTPRDRFKHNLIGILGEGRSKAHVVQPKLMVKCTVTVVPLARNAAKK